MTEKRKTEIQQRFKKKDHDRLAKKAVEHVTGEYILSDSSTEFAAHIVPGYQEQDKQDKKHAGSSPKRKEGIWQEAAQQLAHDPDIGADSLWHALDGAKVGFTWELWIEDDRLYQYDLEAEKTTSISKSTFQRHYFSKIKNP